MFAHGDAGVRVVQWSDGRSWDRFVEAAADETALHVWAWRDIIQRAYGHTPIYLAAVAGEDLVGVLPMFLMKSRLFGRHLVSIPFMDYGGLCTSNSPVADLALTNAAIGLSRHTRAPLELRHVADREIGLPSSLEKVAFRMDLGADEDELFGRLSRQRRRQIRKAQRASFETSIHGPESLREFYRVHAESMRDLGSPVHSKRFFNELMTGLGDRARIILIRSGDELAGAGMLLFGRSSVSIPWLAAFRRYLSDGANQLLHWDAMRHALQRGIPTFDFGRSSIGSGPFRFKLEWGADQHQLHWHHFPDGGLPSEAAGRLEWGVRLWKRLPIPVAGVIGPPIRRGIPN